MPCEHEPTIEREVRADDPNLTPEANELLTTELKAALGTERVRVPAERAQALGRVAGAGHSTLGGTVAANRLLIGITFAALLVIGAIVALATGSWWAVVVAAGVHALATLAVASMTLTASTQIEHVAPETAARLEDEGVADPDRALSELVEQHAAGGEARGAAEVVSSGRNRVTAAPSEDAVRAAAEQRTALTPAADGVEPAGYRGAPMLLPIVAVAGSVIVGLGAAAVEGGIAWIGALLLVGAALGWLALQMRMEGEREPDTGAGPQREPGDARAGRRARLLPVAAILLAAVVAGVVIVGALGGYL